MTSWQNEIIVTSYGPMTKGEARDYEADAAFEEVIQETELEVKFAQSSSQKVAIETRGKIKAQKVWDSYYEEWELKNLWSKRK
ncbi:hypothetical protein [Mastigocoleus testarum]|uniref:Uncharacterized protein n=1 Tax=Mastigocoleus testarum BC008 TaxID=371196 RepID=A0A0V7ZGE2_9CYAN|nr:hypothetical protein [Mastigocoleus testarum]KST63503.1 hypothetical protein BC008_13650 [Mastigocoleus testarum BC008]